MTITTFEQDYAKKSTCTNDTQPDALSGVYVLPYKDLAGNPDLKHTVGAYRDHQVKWSLETGGNGCICLTARSAMVLESNLKLDHKVFSFSAVKFELTFLLLTTRLEEPCELLGVVPRDTSISANDNSIRERS